MKLLRKAIQDGALILDLKAWDLETIFHQALNLVVAQGLLSAERRDEVEAELVASEQQTPTAIGHAVAIPHLYRDAFSRPVVVFVRLAHPLNMGAPDGIPTRFVCLLLGPPGSASEHLNTLANLARLMSDDNFRYESAEARNAQELLAALDRFVSRTAPRPVVRPPQAAEGLSFTGRFLGGVLQDLRRRWPHYASDVRDGLHPKCLASVLFLFFACLAPTIAFGGLLAVLTDGQIGVVETVLATGLGGVLYAVFSGQPLTIIASTGPIVIFLGVLYSLCADLGLEFLPALGWVGLWTAAQVLLLAFFDVSAVVRFCTRFTDEIFAVLIGLIYIREAIRSLAQMARVPDASYDKGLLSVLLGLGTFYVAMTLSQFRRSRYLLPRVREFFADFGPAIALGLMTWIAVQLPEMGLDRLASGPQVEAGGVGERLATTTGRPWLVDLMAAPLWVRFAAGIPALLATMLVFLDQNVTVRLVNSPDHRLQKGPGYHLDLTVIGTLIGLFSLFGLPWLVAATVRSLNHVRSLAQLEEVVTAEGTSRERVRHVRENRLTGFAIHLLIGLSLLLLPWLEVVPLAALFGLFLYMGVVSMAGNQFFERLQLWLTDPALYPATHYIRRVPAAVVHKYTLLQLVCLGVLWLVKVSPLAILFPLFIAVLPPIRMLAGRLFPPQYLDALDAAEEPEEDEDQWI